ncbi:MAG: hypothetical protein K2Y32_17730 [Candidatus Obscuribacterales bacterium]|nr:hypothetical protein [Candidatus Obscuribacterales bacterium]
MQDQNQTPAESESRSSSTSSANQENQETKNMATIDNNQSNNQQGVAPAKPVPPQKFKPGEWGPIPRQQPIDPATAKGRIESRPLPDRVYDPKAPRTASPLAFGAEVKSFAPGFASNTVAGPANIVELTRALRNDLDLIYEWVFNNIENHVTYGLQKGAVGAIIDGFGNSFDQADLMVQLLRQAGFTANYVNGELRMNGAQAADWLGTDPANVFSASNFLANCLVPVTTVYNGTEWVMDFSHTWVVVTISGTDYVFDPALKTYTAVAGTNLASAMGYNAATFLSDANSGATITADYVQNMNRTNIRNNLDTLANNLVSWMKTNAHGATLDEILGGRTINQYDAATPLRQTAHPFLKPGSTPTVWTSIPSSYKTTMRVLYDTIDTTFYSDDLAGKRMTLFFNASHQAELRLDGNLIGTSSVQTPGSFNSVLLEIVHPYPYTWADQSVWYQIWEGKPYLLCHSFGNTGASASSIHSRKEKASLAAGLASNTEAVVGEAMAATWKMWDASGTQLANIINRLTNCTTANHHAAGIIGWFDTPYTNIGMVKWSTGALDNNYNNASTNDTVLAMHGVAMETQIFNQFAKIDGVSTTPLIDIANSAGQKIYDASSSNWVANVRPNLTNYVSTDLDDIKAWWIDWGYRVGIPEDGQITRGSWTGFGYYAIPTFGTFGIIQGGLKGGSATCAQSLDKLPLELAYYQDTGTPCGSGGTFDLYQPALGSTDTGLGWNTLPALGTGGIGYNPVTSSEPIDMLTGDYLLNQADINIGSMGFPYGLSFSRSYNSAYRFQDGPLGLGWKHNFQMFAQKGTDALMGMGNHSIIGAAAAIAELYVAVDIQRDLTKPFSKYITCALASQWFIDNLIDNAVMISTGNKSMLFIKLRDGSYTPPRVDNGILSLVSGAYKYKTLGGTEFNFDSTGKISTWVAPFGVTVTFTYTSGKLTSVSNGLGRTLTLSYTGDRLTSVSDGTGRSVSYTVDGSKNLTAVVDPNGKSWTFEYDLPGRMTKHFYPANPTVAISTNTYDSLDRVKEQRDYQSNLWQYFFAGSRSQEVNPNGKGSVIYNGVYGLPVKTINQVGKISTTVFDGRARVKKSTVPEGNSIEFVYDVKDRVTQNTLKAKPGSGLSDIVSSATYDATWNGLKTATDPMGRVTTLNYDPTNGNLLTVVSPSVTGLGSSTVTMTYNGRGQILTVTSPDGVVAQNTYDVSTERLLSTVADFGVGRLNLTVNYNHNARGDVTTVQDPRGNISTTDFDVLRRVTQVTAPSPFSYLTKFSYDDNSNVTKVEKQTNDPENPWQTVQSTFTADNKLLTMTDPLGVVSSVIQYDNLQRLWKITDGLSRTVERFYDDANRVSSIKDPAGITAVTYTYRDNGQVATIKDARNNLTTYSFDGLDRLEKATYPDLTFEQVTSRDGNGNPLTLVMRSGATFTLTYDELNRVKTKTPSGQPTVTRIYDIAGRVVTVSTPVVAGDPSSGTFTNFYDSAGRFYKEQYPDGLSVTHQLDANGNQTRTTYPDGYYIDRVFDQLNRLTDIKLNGAGTSAVQFQYDALSRRTKLIYENGCSTSYGFDKNNSVDDLLHNFVGSNVNFSYAFDAVGQMLSQRVSDPANFRWTPGAPGTLSYGTANSVNLYPSVGGTGFSYGTDGTLTNDGVFKYEYNSERMMTRVRDAGTNAIVADYLYDPALRQRQKNVGGTKTNFYYSGWQRLADYDGTANTLQQRYVYGLGFDEVLIQITSGGTKTYFHGNYQSSVVATTDASGAVLNRFKYSPYGESSSMSGTSQGFTGQRYDSETGLYYYKMRHYSPKLGRFLQPDPIAYGAGLNMNAYVGNSPLNAVDSIGLRPAGTGDGLTYSGPGPIDQIGKLEVFILGWDLGAINPLMKGKYHTAILLKGTDINTGDVSETLVEAVPNIPANSLKNKGTIIRGGANLVPYRYSYADAMARPFQGHQRPTETFKYPLTSGLFGLTFNGSSIISGDPYSFGRASTAADEMVGNLNTWEFPQYRFPILSEKGINSNMFVATILSKAGILDLVPEWIRRASWWMKPFEGDTSSLSPTGPIPEPGGLPDYYPGPAGEESYYSEQSTGGAEFGAGGSNK